ncbi:MAG: hypothetical protein HKM90_07760 [Desulfobacteraceae bacterium]|nr:hypothetical protein [Desulfobacteraceae bacterium]
MSEFQSTWTGFTVTTAQELTSLRSIRPAYYSLHVLNHWFSSSMLGRDDTLDIILELYRFDQDSTQVVTIDR